MGDALRHLRPVGVGLARNVGKKKVDSYRRREACVHGEEWAWSDSDSRSSQPIHRLDTTEGVLVEDFRCRTGSNEVAAHLQFAVIRAQASRIETIRECTILKL
jgi:hypothetical protein